MREITNRLGLPESIVQAVRNDPYSMGSADISVTGLIGPARKRVLERLHHDEIIVDAADRIWSLYGQVMHGILERADLTHDQIITERRLFITRHGWRISGQFDRLILKDKTILQDYKFTSVYAVKDGVKPEYEAQQNLYALMLAEHGYKVDSMQIVAPLRDWSKMQARNSKYYPQAPVVVLDVDMWPAEKTEQFLYDRLVAHGAAQTELPECTDDERWCSETVWKVKKKGNKKATKGCANIATEAEANRIAVDLTESTNKIHLIEFHPGEAKRCADYCEAAPFCSQWQAVNPNKLGL